MNSTKHTKPEIVVSHAPLTQMEFADSDFKNAEIMAKKLGYEQTVYTSTSDLIGLFCLPENPKLFPHKPHHGGCIIKTAEFGLVFVQTSEELNLEF